MTLQDCINLLEKRRKQLLHKNMKELAVAYQEVVIDLIDNTDSCTGELY
jgi:hypothetical protein